MTPTPAENSSSDRAGNNRELLAEVLSEVPLLGKLLAKIVLQRRWGLVLAILLIGWFFLVYPLLVPIIAATLINAGVLREWHQPYAESVRTAFRVEELAGRVATLGNQRLDYFQVVEVVARNANQLHTYSFSVQPNQRVRFRKEEATVYSTDPVRCAVPRELLTRRPSCSPCAFRTWN